MKKNNKFKKVLLAGFVSVLTLTGFGQSAEAFSYKVKKGDTLYKIAQKNNTTVDKIKKENNLKSNTIKIGQNLEINSNKTVKKSVTVTKKGKSQTLASQNSVVNNIIDLGKENLGKPYKLGSAKMQNASFDCSSFTQYIFAKNGISLPATSSTQSQVGTKVSRSDLQAGDLVFFTTNGYGTVSHVALYIGNGQLLHAVRGGVKIDGLSENYWSKRYLFAKRVI